MTNLPTGTVTFLFTDIEGSTRLLTTLGVDTYSRCLADHDAMIRQALAEHDGVEVRTEGDSFFAVFTDAISAVKAVADSQRALAGHDWPSEGVIKVRMGLHTGEGRLGGDNYVGIDVHRAARISDAANGGQILVSAATVEAAQDAALVGLEFEDLGEKNLKDFSAVVLSQLNIEGLPHHFPPLRGLQAVEQSLPAQMTSFVGREREVKEITDLLDDRRLLTLTGPGGTRRGRVRGGPFDDSRGGRRLRDGPGTRGDRLAAVGRRVWHLVAGNQVVSLVDWSVGNTAVLIPPRR